MICGLEGWHKSFSVIFAVQRWNATFGNVTVIQQMLIFLVTFNDLDNAMLMRKDDGNGY